MSWRCSRSSVSSEAFSLASRTVPVQLVDQLIHPQAQMPLARIITNAVDDSLELTMQLRARGFRVETIAPGQIPTTPADLEVRLEECASEEVVARAAAELDGNLCVFIAPGALDERARPVRVMSLTPASNRSSSLAKGEKVSDGELLLFPPLEDDPILADLAGDVILAEQQQSVVPSVPAKDPRFVTMELPEKGAADASPQSSASLEIIRIPNLDEKVVATASAGASLAAVAKSAFSIPRVPDPVAAPVLAPKKEAQEPRSAICRISFQPGPQFWRSAWVSAVLVVLMGMLAVIVRMHPHLPTTGAVGPASVQGHAAFSFDPVPALNFAKPGLEGDHVADAGPVAPSSASASRVRFTHAEVARKLHRRSVPSDDIIAEDTVVFYDRPHGSPSPKVAAQTHPRKYSD